MSNSKVKHCNPGAQLFPRIVRIQMPRKYLAFNSKQPYLFVSWNERAAPGFLKLVVENQIPSVWQSHENNLYSLHFLGARPCSARLVHNTLFFALRTLYHRQRRQAV